LIRRLQWDGKDARADACAYPEATFGDRAPSMIKDYIEKLILYRLYCNFVRILIVKIVYMI